MSLDLIPNADVPKAKRKSKIEKTAEWPELIKTLNQGLPAGKSLRVSFSDATLKSFKGNAQKTAQSFVFRLRTHFKDRYRVRLIEGQVYVSKLEKKRKAK